MMTTKKEKSLIANLLSAIPAREAARIEKKMIMAAKIGDALAAKKMQRKDLMKALGKKNASEMSKWLSGTHNFTIDTLSDIEEILGVKLLSEFEEIRKEVVIRYEFHATTAPSDSPKIGERDYSGWSDGPTFWKANGIKQRDAQA